MAFVYTSYIVNAWDSWAVSQEGVAGYGYFEFSFAAQSGAVCGIAEAGIPEQYTQIRHGFYFEQSQYQVIELGAVKTAKAACSTSTRFRVERYPGGIRYLVDGVIVRSVPETQPTIGLPIHLYGSIYSYGEKIINAVLVNLGGEAELEATLPGYTGFGTTDTISAIAGLNLPALTGSMTAEDGLAIIRNLPAYIGFSATDAAAFIAADLPALDAAMSLTEHDVWLRTNLPALLGAAATDNVCRLEALLPALGGFGEQSDIMPGRLAIEAALPAITGYAQAVDSIAVDLSLPAILGMAITQSGAEAADMTVMLGQLPAIVGSIGVGASNFILLRVPVPQIQWLGMKDYISVDAFRLDGWMFGQQTGGWIEGELFSLEGALGSGGWIASAITAGLQGEMSGSVVAEGDIEGDLFRLAGLMYAGGHIDSVLTTLTGSLLGSSEYLGRIEGALTELSGIIAADAEYQGVLRAEVFRLDGQVLGSTFVNGALFGELAVLRGAIAAETQTDGRLEGELWTLGGRLGADPAPIGELEVAVFTLAGSLSCIALAGQAQCVTMKYSRY